MLKTSVCVAVSSQDECSNVGRFLDSLELMADLVNSGRPATGLQGPCGGYRPFPTIPGLTPGYSLYAQAIALLAATGEYPVYVSLSKLPHLAHTAGVVICESCVRGPCNRSPVECWAFQTISWMREYISVPGYAHDDEAGWQVCEQATWINSKSSVDLFVAQISDAVLSGRAIYRAVYIATPGCCAHY